MSVLTTERIKELFQALDEELRKKDVVGEVGICGGAVMCLVFQARPATKDVAAIFEPTREIRKAAKAVAARCDVPEDWLNDAAKAFFHADPPREEVLNFPNLRVWAPTAKYMLAMKCISARFDSHDLDDTKFLVKYLQLWSPAEVFEIIEAYYPRRLVPPKTQFLVEELFPAAGE
ncbi:MAG: hypothetical protein A3K19_15615 [Lentisphaerae bacterium RIFOXYB12_FULL_65_16]|nr:MAG: hypothetical protein A3K18_11630 [Lentisphaerae bacterium RIFOXYA12_64_32]OGV88539.1 MAG: hypothetical protein A3K19_15615 [Lentisphaerae bacterium RIFOXYB12_FULL_65_16]